MRLRVCVVAAAVVALSVLVLCSWTAAAADGFQEGYELGKQEGKADTPFFDTVWGFVGNVFAFGIAVFGNPPDPSAVRMQQLEGMSSDYKTGYLEGYAESRQVLRLSYIGGGLAVFTILVTFVAIGLAATP